MCDFSARCKYPGQSIRSSKKNHSVAAPGAAKRKTHLAERFYRPACGINLLKPEVSEETDEAAVGRPEGLPRAFRAGERPGFSRIERAHPEPVLAAGRRGEGQITAIRRHGNMFKARLFRRRDRKLYHRRIGRRLAREVCPGQSEHPQQQDRSHSPPTSRLTE